MEWYVCWIRPFPHRSVLRIGRCGVKADAKDIVQSFYLKVLYYYVYDFYDYDLMHAAWMAVIDYITCFRCCGREVDDDKCRYAVNAKIKKNNGRHSVEEIHACGEKFVWMDIDMSEFRVDFSVLDWMVDNSQNMVLELNW